MELLQLEYFRVLARTEHITNAARELHIAQPSLSQTLKRLEQEVGVPLFDRTGKRIVLNDAGRIFLKYADNIFLQLQNASLELDAYRGTADSTVSLTVHAASFLLPNIIKEIKRADSRIQLKIIQHFHADAGIPEGDLLLDASCHPPKGDGSALLLEESLGIAIPKSHPLAQRERICLCDLQPEPFLALSPDSSLAATISYYCSQADFYPDITTTVNSPNILRDLLRMNLGLAFMPELTWKDFAAKDVVYRGVADLPMKRYLTLSWNPDKYMSPAVCTCRDTILAYFTRYTKQSRESTAS